MSKLESQKCGWSVKEWMRAVGLSPPSVYKLINSGQVDAVKVGHRTVIRTNPRDYLASLPTGLGSPPPGSPWRNRAPVA